jgi:hypothetical protein
MVALLEDLKCDPRRFPDGRTKIWRCQYASKGNHDNRSGLLYVRNNPARCAQMMIDHGCGEIPVVDYTENNMPSESASAAGRSV